MATPGEMAQDQERVLDALVKARRYVEAHDHADSVRDDQERKSALQRLLDLAEKAGERVHAYLAEQEPTPQVGRDGGPI